MRKSDLIHLIKQMLKILIFLMILVHIYKIMQTQS